MAPKKTAKRSKSRSFPKRAAVKPKVKKPTKARASSRSKAPSFSSAGSKLKRVARKAASAAVLAAGVAGIGTALGELKKEQTKIAPDESSRKAEGKNSKAR